MNANKGKVKFGSTGSLRVFISKGVQITTAICLSVLFAGCVHWPDIASDCESYGVRESNQPMGTVVNIAPLYRDQLEINCAGAPQVTALNNERGEVEVSGCAIQQPNGTVQAYYWVGDKCAMNHELCHARHGSDHTERYNQELENGIPMPYCPKNQLRVFSGPKT